MASLLDILIYSSFSLVCLVVKHAASTENMALTHKRPVSVTHQLTLVAHSARPVDLDDVIEDFVHLNDQCKDDFGLYNNNNNNKDRLTAFDPGQPG